MGQPTVADWLVREAGLVLSWWALVTLAGAAALPLCLRLLGALPDRGYTLARAAGVLLVAFVFWLLASLGFVNNSTGSMILAWAVVLIASLAIYARLGAAIDLRAWWRENRTAVIVSEVLFLVLLFAWAYVRAQQNNLTGTEKPMELMFMNSVQRSAIFPPNDGWMSGYSISYYYFGYIMSAMLSMLSGVPATTGFNLTISLLFALTGLGGFGVVYNLVRSRAFDPRDDRKARADAPPSKTPALIVGLLGMALLILIGNFQLPFVELPYQMRAASADYLRLWNVDQRQVPVTLSEDSARGLNLNAWDNWWWFRSARTLNDLDLNGGHIEVIDEFPAFSFLLADTHPHVLALPFALLALGMALNLLLSGRPPSAGEIGFYALCIGGLAFLNTWDGPVYLAAIVGAEALRRLMRNGGRLKRSDWLRVVWLGLVILVVGFVLYLPFWLGFRSQASGALPNIINPTLPQQYFLMFGPFIFLIAPFLLVEAIRAGQRMNWGLGVSVALFALGLLIVGLLALIVLASVVPELRNIALSFADQAGGLSAVLPLILSRRLSGAITALGLLAAIVVVIARLFPRQNDDSAPVPVTYPAATGFALLLIGMGLVLTLAPEFVYLRDNFGTRMNTIFKFYYQAWLLFGIGAAYGIYTVLADYRLRVPAAVWRVAYAMLIGVVLTLGLLFPILGIYSRTQVETGYIYAQTPPTYTLDGGSNFIGADDYAAIECLNSLVPAGQPAVAVEAIGPAYHQEYGRVAALSGIPIVLGWENHEGQWRGSTYFAIRGTRNIDIPLLYKSENIDDVRRIVDAYGIDYIFYGQTEHSVYGAAGEQKFRDRFDVVCERGNSRFYVVNSRALASAR